MRIDRDQFLSALFALTLTGAAAGCSGEEPPAAEPEMEQTTGAEEPMAEPPPAPEAPAEPAPAAEPVPEVEPAGPTPE
jgi:hypothetical protein